MALAERIMRRAIQICPHLVPKGSGIEALQVVRHQVGLRPGREGGPRVEAETITDDELGKLHVVHSYGAAGFGYQCSYGMANLVVDLVKRSIEEQVSL
jgi:D-amino-acid oxidase